MVTGILPSEASVALQGTIETFPLPDVLRLLAATRKSGKLHLHAERVTGDVWLEQGRIVWGAIDDGGSVTEPVGVLVALLRAERGSFFFEPDSPPPASGAPLEVEPLVVRAEEQLVELRALLALVPSLDVWVTLVDELPHHEITIDAARWRLLAAIRGGATLAAIADDLDLDELSALRAAKDSLELGIVTLSDAPSQPLPAAPTFVSVVPLATTVIAQHGDAEEFGRYLDGGSVRDTRVPFERTSVEVTSGNSSERQAVADTYGVQAMSAAVPTFDPVPPSLAEFQYGLGQVELSDEGGEPARVVPGSLGARSMGAGSMGAGSAMPRSANAGGDTTMLDEVEADFDELEDLDDDDPAEIANQLANLSPRAAKAVAAAAKATTDEERDAALAMIEAEDSGLNRGMLLKFLGSVDG
jgi:hypothetical protein